jgi:tetratricopeptide (TPR) repeat protein
MSEAQVASRPQSAPAAGAGRRRRWWLVVLGLVVVAAGAWPAWTNARNFRDLQAVRNHLDRAQCWEAIQLLEQMALRRPNDAEVQYLLAVAHRRGGDAGQFQVHLAKAADLGWPPEDIERQQVLLTIQIGDVQAGQNYLAQLPDQQHSDVAAEEVYEAYVRGCLTTYRLVEVEAFLGYWLQWQPDHPRPHLFLGQLHEQRERWGLAEEEYRKVIAVDPGCTEARGYLGRVLMKLNRHEEALPHFLQAASERPDEPQGALHVARCYDRLGNPALAAEFTQKVLDNPRSDGPARAAALLTLGQVRLREGQPEEAVTLLQQSVEADPSEPGAWYSLGQALYRVGRSDEAQDCFERRDELAQLYADIILLMGAVVHDPLDTESRYQIGAKMIAAGMTDRGVGWLWTVLLYDPENVKALRSLAELYEATGQSARAESYRARMEAIAKRRPQDDLQPLDEMLPDETPTRESPPGQGPAEGVGPAEPNAEVEQPATDTAADAPLSRAP